MSMVSADTRQTQWTAINLYHFSSNFLARLSPQQSGSSGSRSRQVSSRFELPSRSNWNATPAASQRRSSAGQVSKVSQASTITDRAYRIHSALIFPLWLLELLHLHETRFAHFGWLMIFFANGSLRMSDSAMGRKNSALLNGLRFT